MIRLFAALAIPPQVGQALMSRQTGIAGARWRPLDSLHITLRFFGETAESAGAVELTALLLMIGATFFVFDGLQTIAAGALRGMNDTRIPLLFAAVSYWLIGFSTACGLARLPVRLLIAKGWVVPLVIV